MATIIASDVLTTDDSFCTSLQNSVKRAPQFDAWIDMYAGDDFEKKVRDVFAKSLQV